MSCLDSLVLFGPWGFENTNTFFLGFFFFFLAMQHCMLNLSSPTREQTPAPAVGAQSLNS